MIRNLSLQVRCYWDWRMWWMEHNRAIPLMHTGPTQLASVVTMKLEVGVLSQALRPPHRCLTKLTKSLRPSSTAIDGRKALFIFPCTYPGTWDFFSLSGKSVVCFCTSSKLKRIHRRWKNSVRDVWPYCVQSQLVRQLWLVGRIGECVIQLAIANYKKLSFQNFRSGVKMQRF